MDSSTINRQPLVILKPRRIQFQLYVAGRRVKVVSPYAGLLHLDPPPGSGELPFRIWRGECCLRPEWATAPGVLEIMFAKNFSIPPKFGIINLRFKTHCELLQAGWRGNSV
jgi:hypothetical protein